MKVAIHQPNYLPHPAYFLKISKADAFVFLDDVQLSSGSFTSRTDLCGNWLSVPVKRDNKNTAINMAPVDNSHWQRKHLNTIRHCFSKKKYFPEVYNLIEPVYISQAQKLIDYNVPLIIRICEYLNIKTPLLFSSQFPCSLPGSEKLLHILKTLNASVYISGIGAGAQRYADSKLFQKHNIIIEWLSANHLPKTSVLEMLCIGEKPASPLS